MKNRRVSLHASATPIAFNSLNRANDVLSAIQQTINALAAGLIDALTARTILYGLQIASANMKRAEQETRDTNNALDTTAALQPITASVREDNAALAEATTSLHEEETSHDSLQEPHQPISMNTNVEAGDDAEEKNGNTATRLPASHQPAAPLRHDHTPMHRLRLERDRRALAARGLRTDAPASATML